MSYKPIRISIESLRIDSSPDCDLYLKRGDNLVLYREGDHPFNEKDRQKLIENKVTEIYIQAMDQKKYYRYIENNLEDIISDEMVPIESKAELLYGSSKELMLDVMNDPCSGENIKRSRGLVDNTVNLIVQDPAAFKNLVKVTSYDYYTYTHSIQVGFFPPLLPSKRRGRSQAPGSGSFVARCGQK